MSDIDFRCSICEASFKPGVIDKDGKCPACAEQYPTVKNKMEAMALSQPNLHLGKKLDEKRVREIVREELNFTKSERKAAALKKAREVRANRLEETKGDK